MDVSPFARWAAWFRVFRTLEALAPEALEDLARIPYPKEALRELKAHGWLPEEGLEGLDPGPSVEGLKHALTAWQARWRLPGPWPQALALQALEWWHEGGGSPPRLPPILQGAWVEGTDPPPPPPLELPRWEPPALAFPWGEGRRRKMRSWEAYRRAAQRQLDQLLKELYREKLPQPRVGLKGDFEEGLSLFVLHRVKGWPLRGLYGRARHEGLVRGGRVVVPRLSVSSAHERLKRIEVLLGLRDG